MKIDCNGESVEVRLEGEEAVVGDRRVAFRVHRRDGEVEAVEVGARIFPIRSVGDGQRVLVWCEGRVFELRRTPAARSRETADGLLSPMPGRVRQVLVAVGDTVGRGQVLLVLEAMKMEHAIRAPRDGTVAALAYKEGDLVEAGVKLAEIT